MYYCKYIRFSSSHYLSLTSPLLGTFTWPTPPGPYIATTCRERELTKYHIHTFFYHTRTWRASSDEGSAQCRGHLRDSTNMKDDTIHTPIHSNKVNKKGWLWRPNDIRGPWGLKASWHVSYRWGKTPKKNRKIVPTGDRTWPAAWKVRMLPPAPQRWIN